MKENRITQGNVMKIVDQAYGNMEKLSLEALKQIIPNWEQYEEQYLIKFSNLCMNESFKIRNDMRKQTGKRVGVNLI